jgi:hypothetical protein
MVDGWWDADKNKIRWSADFRIDVSLFGVCLSVYRGEGEKGRGGEGESFSFFPPRRDSRTSLLVPIRTEY